MNLEQKAKELKLSLTKRVKENLSRYSKADKLVAAINAFAKLYNLPLSQIEFETDIEYDYGDSNGIARLEAIVPKTEFDLQGEIDKMEADIHQQKVRELQELNRLKQKYEGK